MIGIIVPSQQAAVALSHDAACDFHCGRFLVDCSLGCALEGRIGGVMERNLGRRFGRRSKIDASSLTFIRLTW